MIALSTTPLNSDIDRNQQDEDKEKALPTSVRMEFCGDDRAIAASLEFLLTQSSKRRGLSRMASRRVAGAKRHAMVDTNTSDLRLMDRARVITTGSRSSEGIHRVGAPSMPRKFDLIAQTNRHCVPNIDCDDFGPTSRHFMERVGDRDSLVLDQYLWTNEDQVASSDHQCGPEGSGDTTSEGEISKTLVGVDQRSESCEREEDISTSWSKDHRISHSQIISWRGL